MNKYTFSWIIVTVLVCLYWYLSVRWSAAFVAPESIALVAFVLGNCSPGVVKWLCEHVALFPSKETLPIAATSQSDKRR